MTTALEIFDRVASHLLAQDRRRCTTQTARVPGWLDEPRETLVEKGTL